MAAGTGYELLSREARRDLRKWVKRITVYRENGAPPYLQREPAGLVVPLIIGFADPFRIALGREPLEDESFTSFAAGLCRRPALIRSPGRACCLQIDFTPRGAFRFFGRMVKDLSDRCVPLEDLQEPGLDRFRERLAEIGDWPRLLDLSEHFVRGRLHEGTAGHPAVDWVLDRLVVSGGGTPISHLAQDIGWSRKHLIARFREQVGLPPKLLARIARFKMALTRVRASPQLGWADVAVTCGYSDQAHLIREFSEFCGLTPTIWMQSIRMDQQRSG